MNPYIQITTVCNYRCRHCCFSCTEQGEYMTMDTFRAALKCSDLGKIKQNKYPYNRIVIGGGEPTLHPNFWEMIELSMVNGFTGEKIWLATNGSQKETTKRLSEMAHKGEISVSVSVDQFRPPLDPEVKEWFTKDIGDKKDLRSFYINNVPIKMGRAKRMRGVVSCCCQAIFITPDGNAYQCGCPERIKIGDVFKGYRYITYGIGDSPTCSRDIKKLGIPPSFAPLANCNLVKIITKN